MSAFNGKSAWSGWLLLLLLIVGISQYRESLSNPAPDDDVSALAEAFSQGRSDVWLNGVGEVSKLLPDDNTGSRHQREPADQHWQTPHRGGPQRQHHVEGEAHEAADDEGVAASRSGGNQGGHAGRHDGRAGRIAAERDRHDAHDRAAGCGESRKRERRRHPPPKNPPSATA